MSSRVCPYCAETIQDAAIKCPHCQTWLTEPPPGAIGDSRSQRLVRSRVDRMLTGVCGGLALHFDIDPTLARIVFVAATFFTGLVPGILTYIVLSFVVPDNH